MKYKKASRYDKNCTRKFYVGKNLKLDLGNELGICAYSFANKYKIIKTLLIYLNVSPN